MSVYNQFKSGRSEAEAVIFNRNGSSNLNVAASSTFTSSLLPATNLLDIGSLTQRWKDLFLSNSLVVPTITATSVNATTLTATNLVGSFVPTGNLVPSGSGQTLGSISSKWDAVYSSGTLYGGGADFGATIYTQHILPKATATYDFGENATRWRNIYYSGTLTGQHATLSGNLTVNSTSQFNDVLTAGNGMSVNAGLSVTSGGIAILGGGLALSGSSPNITTTGNISCNVANVSQVNVSGTSAFTGTVTAGNGMSINAGLTVTSGGIAISGGGLASSGSSAHITTTGNMTCNVMNFNQINLTTTTSTTVGAAGAASALPAAPTGYVNMNINGTTYKLPFYAV